MESRQAVSTFLTYYHRALIVLGTALFFSNLPLYLYQRIGFRMLEAPKHWWILYAVLCSPILIRRLKNWLHPKNALLLWCAGYIVISILWFYVSSQGEIPWQELRYRFQSVLILCVFFSMYFGQDPIRLARLTLAGVILFDVGINVYEFFVPDSFSTVFGRSAGLYLNPNIAGECMVLGMVLSVTALPRPLRLPFMVLTGIGVFATFSRAGILTWAISVAGFLLLKQVRPKDLLIGMTLGSCLIVLVLLPRLDALLSALDNAQTINSNVLDRLAWFTDPTGVENHSTWERRYIAARAWEKFEDGPVIGHGTGSSYEAEISPHNQYLAFMLDHGVLGLLIFPSLVLAVIWNARAGVKLVGRIFGTVLLIFGFFSHGLLGEPTHLLLFALMATMGIASREEVERSSLPAERNHRTVSALAPLPAET